MNAEGSNRIFCLRHRRRCFCISLNRTGWSDFSLPAKSARLRKVGKIAVRIGGGQLCADAMICACVPMKKSGPRRIHGSSSCRSLPCRRMVVEAPFLSPAGQAPTREIASCVSGCAYNIRYAAGFGFRRIHCRCAQSSGCIQADAEIRFAEGGTAARFRLETSWPGSFLVRYPEVFR